MKESILLVHSNLRRAKGQTISIAVLVLLSSLMLNLWLMLSTDYKQNFERVHNRLHAGHVTLMAENDSDEMWDFLTEINEKDRRMEEESLTSVMHMAGSFSHNGGEVSSEFVFLDKETAFGRSVGRAELIEDSSYTSGVYMPVLYKSKDIDVGKEIEISVGSRKMSYTVCGFFNSVMSGSHNCYMCEIILTEDRYQELEESGCAPKAVLCSVRLSSKAESEDYETMLKNTVSDRYPHIYMVSNSYALISQSRYISQTVCSGLLSAMAFFVLLIALVVIASNIIHYIGENMKNLGALKAIGYKSRQLVGALLLQFVGIAIAAALFGGGLSYCVFPFLNEMMVSQTGIPYSLRFLPLPYWASTGILAGAVFAAVYLSSRRMKRIEPVMAFRQGVQTHNFRRNWIPLTKTKVSLTFALALKTALSNVKHNIIICVTMPVLALFVVFSGLMTENMIVDMEPFMKLVVGETADSCIDVSGSAEEEFLEEMNRDDRVEKVYLYHQTEVRHVGGLSLMATVCDDFSKVNNQEGVFEGRFPKYDNEIAVAAKYAGEKNLKLGNEIILTADGKEAAYIISGFTQNSNNLGKDCLFTREGYERLGELQNTSYYLNLGKGTDIDDFNVEIKNRFGSEINAVINIDATVSGGAAVYVALMKAIVAAVLLLSGIIIAFVLYLLVRTIIGSKKRDYGILKALGFTTGQLILQTAFFFMPAVVISTVAGIILCGFVINPLTGLFLRDIGVVKCTFTVPIGFVAAGGAGLIVFAFAVLCLMSLQIRKITPKTLLI
ncbi:MAG: ABC transporter permease [Dorea sp.]|nr:ABC transporter permease [Dorea sp.]